TKTSVFLTNDKTLSDGSYLIVVNEGTYDVHFTPPSGSTLAAAEIEGLSIHSNLGLNVTVLHPGLLVSGTVRNSSGQALQGVDLDLVNEATNRKIFLPNDQTDASGGYAVRVAPGTYDVEYRPLATTQYLTGSRKGLIVSANVTGLTDTLAAGSRVTA